MAFSPTVMGVVESILWLSSERACKVTFDFTRESAFKPLLLDCYLCS